MILAAGLGKRMQPLTLETPKPLIEINNISLLERAINLMISHGVEEISINVHYLPDQIKTFINNKNFIHFSHDYTRYITRMENILFPDEPAKKVVWI